VTTPKLTSSPKAPFTVEASPKTTISKVGVCKSARRTCSFLHSGFPTGFFGMEFLVRRTSGGS
jgi:hypothetical protein